MNIFPLMDQSFCRHLRNIFRSIWSLRGQTARNIHFLCMVHIANLAIITFINAKASTTYCTFCNTKSRRTFPPVFDILLLAQCRSPSMNILQSLNPFQIAWNTRRPEIQINQLKKKTRVKMHTIFCTHIVWAFLIKTFKCTAHFPFAL